MALTQELVRKLFDYKDGLLYRKVRTGKRGKIGDVACRLWKLKNGEVRYRISIENKRYRSARIIFLYHNGYLPEEVDHEDRNTLNDCIENLRDADSSKNNMNKISYKNSISKYKGVYFHKSAQKWCSEIQAGNKKEYLGLFLSETDAALVYNKMAVKLHGEFANLNIIQP